MRVGINGSFLTRPLTGSGRYVQNLASEIAALGLEDGAVPVDPRVYGPSSEKPATWRKLMTPFDRINSPVGEDLAKLWLEQVAFPRAAYRDGCDLIHYPFLAAPLVSRLPVVVTVHDLIPLIFPQYHQSATFSIYLRLVTMAVKKAKLIFADSEASKRDIVRLLGLPEQRVEVTYLACDSRFHSDLSPDERMRLSAFKAKVGLPEEYILYLGGVDYRKNLPFLVRSYAKARRLGLKMPLVVVGSFPEPSELFPDIKNIIREEALEEAVLLLPSGADEETALLYWGASLFVFPSLYEGFGLTPLEAMACGTPVVCSNSSSLPEVVGDAALTFDPTDEESLAALLKRAGSDEALRMELREKGLLRAGRFSWRETARQTLEAYAKALG